MNVPPDASAPPPPQPPGERADKGGNSGSDQRSGKRTGRRPGGADTRAEILAAARAEFAERGFEQTTMRGIARAAGVDPALVHHYFGSKERVFLAAMEFPIDPTAVVEHVVAGDPSGIGERLARFVLGLWDVPEVRERLLALLRSTASSPDMAALFREFALTMLVRRVAPAVSAPDAELRVELAFSQIVGLAMARYVIGVEPIASADTETLVAHLGPTLQRYLT